MQAPSGMNRQPRAFVAIYAEERRAWFGEHDEAAIRSRFGAIDIGDHETSRAARTARALKYQAEHMHEFPLIFLVAGQRDRPIKVPASERVGLSPPDCGAGYPCVQNILLACRALAFGAALTTMHQVFEDKLHVYGSIPDEYGVVVAIPIGYPMGRLRPVPRRPESEVTYFEPWGNADPGRWRRENPVRDTFASSSAQRDERNQP